MRRASQRRQEGFTLIELMVAMTVSSILIYFVFSTQARMTNAFRGQTGVSEVNQNLRAARQYVLSEIRMAGYGLGTATGGIGVAPGIDATELRQGLVVHNNMNGDGNDGITIMYADSTAEVIITDIGPVFARTAEPPPAFADNEPVIMAARTASCLIAVTNTNPNQIHFNPNTGGAPYNQAPQNRHCDEVRAALSAGEPVTIRRAVRRSYRIDPTRIEGYLQVSASGGLVAGDWADLAVGFTNLQFASRYFEDGDLVDVDLDGDPERDWYSSDNQTDPDATAVRPAGAQLVQVSVSVEARSPLGAQGATASSATKAFVMLPLVAYNRLGDWGAPCPLQANTNPCGVDLANLDDASRPERYQGQNIYRSSTTLVDLRNMGVGR